MLVGIRAAGEVRTVSTQSMLRASALILLGTGLLGGCNLIHRTTTAQGIYFGYFAPNAGSTPVAVYGAILPGNYAYFGGVNGNLYVLPNKIDDGNFSDTVAGWPPYGQAFSNGQASRSFSASGQANANGDTITDITGILSGDSGGGAFTITHKDLSTRVPSLSNLAGTYQGYYWGSNSIAVSLTLNSDGSFTFNDGYGCSGSGTLSVTSGYNLLQVSLTSTGSGSVCAGSVNGLGFSDTKDRNDLFNNASGTYIYLGASNSNTGLVAELYKS